MKAIECYQAEKCYRSKSALAGITCTIEEHKIVGVIGRNGAGKSTFLKMAAGFIEPTSGSFTVFGKKPFNNLFVSANSLLIDEYTMFLDTMTLAELCAEGKRFYPNWHHDLAVRLLDYFEINPSLSFRHLSKGTAALFRLIFVLSARCVLTLLDEPMSGMDAAVRKDAYRLLLKEYLAHPRTILISSHQLDEMDDLLEDVLLFDEGQLLLHLPIDELKTYAVRVHGEAAALSEWVLGQEVYTFKTAGTHAHAVIRNTGSIPSHFQTEALSASDVCVYITDKNKGGIDRVFR